MLKNSLKLCVLMIVFCFSLYATSDFTIVHHALYIISVLCIYCFYDPNIFNSLIIFIKCKAGYNVKVVNVPSYRQMKSMSSAKNKTEYCRPNLNISNGILKPNFKHNKSASNNIKFTTDVTVGKENIANTSLITSNNESCLQNPFLQKTKFNTGMDLHTYMNINSPGFVSRIVQSATESSMIENIKNHSIEYDKVNSNLSKFSQYYGSHRTTLPLIDFLDEQDNISDKNVPETYTVVNSVRKVSKKRNYETEINDANDISKRTRVDESNFTANNHLTQTVADVIPNNTQNKRSIHELNDDENSPEALHKKKCDQRTMAIARLLSYHSSIHMLRDEVRKRKAEKRKKVEKDPKSGGKCRKVQTKNNADNSTQADTTEVMLNDEINASDGGGQSIIQDEPAKNDVQIDDVPENVNDNDRTADDGKQKLTDNSYIDENGRVVIKGCRGRIINPTNDVLVIPSNVEKEEPSPYVLSQCDFDEMPNNSMSKNKVRNNEDGYHEAVLDKLISGNVDEAIAMLSGNYREAELDMKSNIGLLINLESIGQNHILPSVLQLSSPDNKQKSTNEQPSISHLQSATNTSEAILVNNAVNIGPTSSMKTKDINRSSIEATSSPFTSTSILDNAARSFLPTNNNVAATYPPTTVEVKESNPPSITNNNIVPPIPSIITPAISTVVVTKNNPTIITNPVVDGFNFVTTTTSTVAPSLNVDITKNTNPALNNNNPLTVTAITSDSLSSSSDNRVIVKNDKISNEALPMVGNVNFSSVDNSAITSKDRFTFTGNDGGANNNNKNNNLKKPGFQFQLPGTTQFNNNNSIQPTIANVANENTFGTNVFQFGSGVAPTFNAGNLIGGFNIGSGGSSSRRTSRMKKR